MIFLNTKGQFILQKRDEKLGIKNPGMIAAWGGALEHPETPLRAAVREIWEETNLRPTESDLQHIGDYMHEDRINGKETIIHAYVLSDIDETRLLVYEGQGYEVLEPKNVSVADLITDFTKRLVLDYSSLVKTNT